MSLNYDRFESYFRGNERAIKGRREEFRGLIVAVREGVPGGNWLDIGAGSGALLDEAREQGFSTYAVESDRALADECLGNGHTTICDEQAGALGTLLDEGRKFDVISVLHVIEHLLPADAVDLVSDCSQLLHSNGLLVLETPNAADSRVMLGSFYRDPTHVRPYPKLLLEFMLEDAGLAVLESYAFDRFAGDHEQKNALDASLQHLNDRVEAIVASLESGENG